MAKSYVMDLRTLVRLRNMHGEIRCRTCGKPIKVGDDVVSNPYRRSNRYKIRHKGCYQKSII